jgi:putative membrane protein insertion efficiency factor
LNPITATRSHANCAGVGPPGSVSPGVQIALWVLRAYKVLLSPYFRGSCRFLPSCADYAAEAFARHGLLGGAWLAGKRLARCHPLCKAGCDPVPARLSRASALRIVPAGVVSRPMRPDTAGLRPD